jgi:hypothetical protein
VQQVEVDVLQPQPAQRIVGRPAQVGGAKVVRPDFGRDKDLGPIDA